jgi:hypothetical protein
MWRVKGGDLTLRWLEGELAARDLSIDYRMVLKLVMPTKSASKKHGG